VQSQVAAYHRSLEKEVSGKDGLHGEIQPNPTFQYETIRQKLYFSKPFRTPQRHGRGRAVTQPNQRHNVSNEEFVTVHQ
jgi:hypothetical protein